MMLQRVFLVLLIFAAFQTCFGQSEDDGQPSENWLKQYGIYNEQFLYHRFDRYSADDILNFRKKLNLILASNSNSEWEGNYSVGYEETVGYSRLHLKPEIGFVSFYIYTCMPELREINYGKITETPDTIQIVPEFIANSPRKHPLIKYVKVRWNDRYYLVEESSLTAFAEKAAGIYIESKDASIADSQKWANHWVSGDLEKDLIGLPEFPASYKKFQRRPIEAKIVFVGKRTVENDKTIGNTTYSESVFYEVKINAGQEQGVKEGMKFEIPEIENELIITKVNAKTAVGLISRTLDENQNEECFGENYIRIPCPKIEKNLLVKTSIGNFYW